MVVAQQEKGIQQCYHGACTSRFHYRAPSSCCMDYVYGRVGVYVHGGMTHTRWSCQTTACTERVSVYTKRGSLQVDVVPCQNVRSHVLQWSSATAFLRGSTPLILSSSGMGLEGLCPLTDLGGRTPSRVDHFISLPSLLSFLSHPSLSAPLDSHTHTSLQCPYLQCPSSQYRSSQYPSLQTHLHSWQVSVWMSDWFRLYVRLKRNPPRWHVCHVLSCSFVG